MLSLKSAYRRGLIRKGIKMGTELAIKKNDISELIVKMKNQFSAALPAHMGTDSFTRVMLTHVRMNPDLMKCSQASLLGGMMQAAQDGLEPGPDGQCYLIPRWSKKTNGYEVHYQRGYQGALELARRTGEYASITVREVRKNDSFDYEEGSNAFLKFKQALGERGTAIAYFAFTKLKTGDSNFTIMGIAEIEDHRDKFASAKNKSGKLYGPWVDDFEAMAMKTVLLRHLKYQPKSKAMSLLLSKDERPVHYKSDGELDYLPPETNPPLKAVENNVQEINEEAEEPQIPSELNADQKTLLNSFVYALENGGAEVGHKFIVDMEVELHDRAVLDDAREILRQWKENHDRNK
jgi:recombination protein RecT